MPLAEGHSKAIISQNIAEMVKAGHSQAQAIAAAYSQARKHSAIDAGTPAQSLEGIVVAFVLYMLEDGRCLWLHRQDGTWGMPGGHIEPGEVPMNAAIRESIEEIGYYPNAGLSLVFDDGHAVIYACADPEFAPVLNDEHDRFIWATIEDMPEPFMTETETHATDLREYDTNGWFEVKDNPISKCGVFQYSGRQISPECEPDRMYSVARLPEELGHPETVESFRLIPWIDNHVMLGSEEQGLTPAERKGIQGVTGEQVCFDGEYLRANLKVMSEAMAGLIANGKRELSAGYRCKWEYAPGAYEGQAYEYVQRRIRGNHLALVNQGRMGPEVAVLDELEKEPQVAEPEKKEDAPGMTLEEAKAHLEKILPMIAEIQKLMSPPAATVDADMKADEVIPGEEKEDKPMPAMDAAEIARQVESNLAAKAKLYGALSPVIGAFDHAEMSVEKMAVYGCQKLELDGGKDPLSHLTGYLRGKSEAKPVGAMDSVTKPRHDNFIDRNMKERA